MTIAAYLRVSTAEQAASGDSLDTQRRQVEAWAQLKGWAAPQLFTERGVSGSVPLAERPEGAALLAGLRSGDVVICAKLDRMFRSASDALGVLEDLKARGVALHLIDLGGDVCGNGISKLVFTILSAVAENERDRIRERIRDVKRNQAAKGEYLGGKRPYGWCVVNGKLIADPLEQRSIRDMRNMVAGGISLREAGASYGLHPESVKRILARHASTKSPASV